MRSMPSGRDPALDIRTVRWRELGAVAATRHEALPVIEQHHVLAICLTPKFAHAIEVHDARPAHAYELQRIESVREVVSGSRIECHTPFARTRA